MARPAVFGICCGTTDSCCMGMKVGVDWTGMDAESCMAVSTMWRSLEIMGAGGAVLLGTL